MNQTSKTLLSALIISLFSLATLQGYRIITQDSSSSQVLGDTTVKSVPCNVINGWQKTYCVGSTTPTPTRAPTPAPPSYISINNIGCSGSYITGQMVGSFTMTTYPYDYWYTITNTHTGQRNIVVYAKGVGGTNAAHLTFYNPFSDIRGGPSMYLVGDGTLYTFAIYQTPYTSGIPNLTTPIIQTQFSKVCTATPTRAPSPIPTRAPTPTPLSTVSVINTKTHTLTPEGTYTRNATGTLTVSTKINANGYNDITTNGKVSSLVPNKIYNLYYCSLSGGCSSNTNNRFTTDANGNAILNNILVSGVNQKTSTTYYIRIWQVAYAGPVPTGPNDCVESLTKACLYDLY